MNIDSARQKMIEQQVRAWDVFDPTVLETLAKIPRERYAPDQFETLAFADTEIPIGYGQSMLTPTVEGRVLQSLALTGTEKVLEIGTGSGFLTACLGSLADMVTSIDIYDDFVARAGAKLTDDGIYNVKLLSMDGTKTLPDGAFDAIAITGSMQQFDTRFVEALKPGGRLFVVLGSAPAMEARLVRRVSDQHWESESLFETVLTPLVNTAPLPQFTF